MRGVGFLKALCGAALLSSPAWAQEDVADAFVEANLLSIFYHELGHAMIDILRLPVFGQEEDAADVASVLLIHDLYEEESAIDIIYAASTGFLIEAEHNPDEVAWWGVHGPDLQRYYNMVCLFAGADPGGRDDVAEELGLPEERFETCGEEFELAYDSWGPVFDELGEAAPGRSIRYRGGSKSLTERLVAEEVAALNEDFVFPTTLTVSVAACGEPNGYYHPARREITICTELDPYLRAYAP